MKKFLLTLILAIATLQPISAQPYRGFADIEAGIFSCFDGYINDPIIGLTTTHGVQLAEKIFIGGGTGILTDISFAAMPLYADFRFDFFNSKKVSPFVDLKAGYALVITYFDHSGLYLNPTVGVRIRLTERMGINIGLSFPIITTIDGGISIKAGIDF